VANSCPGRFTLGKETLGALNMTVGVHRNRSEREVRNIVAGVSDGMFMSVLTKNFISVIDKRR